MLRIIDNKKIELSDDEWRLFNKICDSYKEYGGESLFSDLFETDDKGIILFIKPPSKKQSTLEIFLFIVSVFNHQHIRLMYERIDYEAKQTSKRIDELEKKIAANVS
jgi:hypothetical protein